MKRPICLLGAASAAAMVLAVAPAAYAQPESGSVLEEVVVTARRREEAIQSVPVAVTALSAEQLVQQNVTDVRGLALTTPGLIVEQNPRSSMAMTASMRGQSTRDAVITNDQSIGLYVDDVFLARSQGTVTNLFDVQQVQILRGVQGTLFGRNNTGGAILISTVKPQYELQARAQGTIGNFDQRRFEGMLNIPIIDDRLAMRLGVNKIDRDGVLNNITNGNDGNSRDILGLRGQLRFNPTENWETVLRVSNAYAKQSPNTAIPNNRGFTFSPPTGFYTAVAGAPAIDKLRSQDYSLNTTIGFGEISWKTVFAFHKQRVFTISDSDGYPTPTLDVYLFENQEQTTAETQLTGAVLDDRLQWLLGGFYFKEDGESSSIIPAIARINIGTAKNKASAGFAHLDFDVTDAITIGGGLRYTSETREVESSNIVAGVCTISPTVRRAPTICFADGTADFNYWSWEANLNYQINEDVLVYVRSGKGQKAGGFNNITNEALLNPFSPETAKDLEAGLKADWLGHVLRTNFAVYRTKYDDIQRTRVVPGPAGSPVTRVDNAAAATIWGVEAEGWVRPTEGLTLAASFAYTDAKYDDFVLSGVDVSNNEFPFVPKYTYSLSGTYDHPIGGLGVLTLHADWTYRDHHEFAVVNTPTQRQSGYGLLGARASLTFENNPRVRVAVFGTNLTDEKYNVASVDLPFGYQVLYRGEPRLYGVELTVSLGGS
jgi:iron complex outermembrane receptor protein